MVTDIDEAGVTVKSGDTNTEFRRRPFCGRPECKRHLWAKCSANRAGLVLDHAGQRAR